MLLTPGGGTGSSISARTSPSASGLAGRDVLARPELVGDADEIERLLGIITAANPMAGRFVAIPKSPDGRLDRASLDAAVRYGFRIIRWHLDDTRAPRR